MSADLEVGYAALHAHAVLIDRSDRLRMTFRGDKAAEALTGLLTNDVLALKPGDGQYAAALTAKGKVIADVRVFARGDHWLVDVPSPAADGFRAMIRKFMNPRLAKYEDVSASLRDIGVFGPEAATVVRRAMGTGEHAFTTLAPHHHFAHEWNGSSVMIASAVDLGVRGYDLMVQDSAAESLRAALVAAGAVPAGSETADVARIEAGHPLWSVDMDETTLAHEANLEALGAISYTKGCYTGQETVARLHFRGHVNKSLRGLTSDVLLPRHAQLYALTGEPCGDVRSSIVSPKRGPIALAMIREAVVTNEEVEVRWDGGAARATVRTLPFS